MPVNRFGWFLSNLHINDNTEQKGRGDADNEKLFKARPSLTFLVKTFR